MGIWRYILIFILVIIILRFLGRAIKTLFTFLRGDFLDKPPMRKHHDASRIKENRDIKDAEFKDLPDDTDSPKKM